MNRARLGLFLLLSVAASGACGEETSLCRSLAETVCGRWVSCGFIESTSKDRCVADEVARCDAGYCGLDLLPVAGEVEACRDSVAESTCDRLWFGNPCPDVRCMAPEGDDAATARYFAGYVPTSLLPCHDTPAPRIGGLVEVRILLGEGVSERDMLDCTQGLQRYFEPLDLWFYTSRSAESVAVDTLLDAADGEIVYALGDAGLSTDGQWTPEEVGRAGEVLSALLFAPLRAFMRDHAADGHGHVNVVLVRSIVGHPIGASLFPDGKPNGLGLSPTMLSRSTDQDELAQLYGLLGLEEDFTPTVFIARDAILLDGVRCDFAMAHHMGHALGLPHALFPGNLMHSAEVERCVPVLDQEQSDALVDIRALR